jgi:hypothetical protein
MEKKDNEERRLGNKDRKEECVKREGDKINA